MDPVTQNVEWRYEGSGEDQFYSECCGTNQKLPNGNVLITETGEGRAFEVSPDGEIVWDYYVPHRAGPNDEYVAQLFEMKRLERSAVNDWLPSE